MVKILIGVVVIVVVAFAALYDWIVFDVLPRYYDGLGLHGRKQSIQGLELLLKLPAIKGSAAKRNAKIFLNNKYLVDKRYEDCVRLSEELLTLNLGPALDAQVRVKLADAHEALGHVHAAKDMRAEAIQSISEAPNNVSALLAKAKLLDEGKRYADSIAVYKRCLTAPDLKP